MTKLTRLILISVVMIFAVPAYAGTASQVWHCELDDDASEDDVMNGVEEWLARAHQLPGGKDFTARVLFPVVVNSTGEIDFLIVVTAPTHAAWGTFWDSYFDSDLGDFEDTLNEQFVCPDSTLWQVETIDVGDE